MSEVALGVVLSQMHGEPGKLHPCAFFLRKLTYDISNCELLAVEAALEKWCHW